MTGGAGTGTPSTSGVNTNIAELRRRVGEPTTTTYSDATLQVYIEKFPLIDAYGRGVDDIYWVESYDLSAAAAAIWSEKAAALVANYDFSADGASYNRSQIYEQTMTQARYWSSRRAPRSMRVVVAHDYERDTQATEESVIASGGGDTTYIINMPEPDDED